MPVKPITLEFDSFADGINLTDPATDVGSRYFSRNARKQARSSLDLMLHTKKQRPGSTGLQYALSGKCYGLGNYLRHDGTEYLLTMIGSKLYLVYRTDGSYAELFDCGGTGQAWFADILDICIGANGVKTFKVEGESAYQLGIDAPIGGSAEVVAGGSLTAGVWNVKVSYARKVDGSNVLYSQGQSLGNVTLSTGNQTIRVTLPNSSDLQVNNKVVWLQEPSGAIHYFYHQTNDNTTTTIDVSSNASKSTSLLYATLAEKNYPVPAFEYICIMNNYLYGSVGNVLYRSRQAGTRYDLERFDTSTTGNRAIMPYTIKGLFTLGEHLYINTPGGMLKLPYGDIGSAYDHVEKLEYFRYPRTVKEYSGLLIGLTGKHRLGAFDGTKMYPHDIAQDIKPYTDKLKQGYSADHEPAAEIYRASDRTEYHLGYRNLDHGILCNNRRLVLNLDKLALLDNNQVVAPWEVWSNGFEYMVVDQAGDWYCAQATDTISVIYKRNLLRNKDENIWVGDTLETAKQYGWSITSGTIMPSIKGLVRWMESRLLATFSQDVTLLTYIKQYNPRQDSNVFDVAETSQPLYGVARYGIDRYGIESPLAKKEPIKRSTKGRMVYVVLSQSADDPYFELVTATISGILTESRFT